MYFNAIAEIWNLSEIPLAQWVGQKGTEALGTGSNFILFYTIITILRIVPFSLPSK